MTSTDKLVKIFTGSLTEAKIIESKLKEKKVPVMIKDNFEGGIATSGSSDDVEVYIDEVDLNQAEDVVADVRLHRS